MSNNNGEIFKLDARRKEILDILAREGRVKVAELSQLLGASEVTIRNDLAELDKEGVLERTHGGARKTQRAYYNMTLKERGTRNAEIKQRIAQAAAELVHDGDTLLINSGTTTHFVAQQLRDKRKLKVVTNSISIAMELGDLSNINVILLGGNVNIDYTFTYGDDTLAQLRKYKADKLILSVDGIDEEAGITTYHAEEAEVNKAMIERAHRNIVVADHTKIGYECFAAVAPLEAIEYLITDGQAGSGKLDMLGRRGVEIQLV